MWSGAGSDPGTRSRSRGRRSLGTALVILVVLSSLAAVGASAPVGLPGAPGASSVLRLGGTATPASPASLHSPAPFGPTASATNLTEGWMLGNQSANPPARSGEAIADDPAEGGVVLFGGASEATSAPLNDSWLFHAGQWTELCSGTSAAPRCLPNPPAIQAYYPLLSTYDAHDHELVLWLPEASTGSSSTWVLRNGSWQNVTEYLAPPANSASMAYDATDGYVLWVDQYGDTWKFSNATWTVLSPATSPQGYPETLFTDPQSGGVVLWGAGYTYGYLPGNQTWVFHAGSWTELTPVRGPRGNVPVASAYDTLEQRGVLLGPKGVSDGSTWTFVNRTWTNQTGSFGVGPIDRNGSSVNYYGYRISMAFDSTDGYTVAVDQLGTTGRHQPRNETWILRDPLTINLSASASVREVGQNVTYSIRAQGGADPYALNWTGLPTGCAPPPILGDSLTFTCAVPTAGAVNLTVRLTDRANTSVTASVGTEVLADPGVHLVSAPDPTTVGIPVDLTAALSSGTPPYASELWTLSDGGTGNGTSFRHVFAKPGTYTADFSAVDALGVPLSANLTVTVDPPPALQLSSSANITDVGLPVRFAATGADGTPPLTYAWNWGDGSGAAGPAPEHTYTVAGTYDPTAWANDSVGASGNATIQVQVDPALVLEANATRNDTPVNVPVGFTATASGGTPPYRFDWQFDYASNATALAQHAFATPGPHVVHLRVYDALNISAARTFTIEVAAPPPNGSIPVPLVGTPTVPGAAVVVGIGLGLLAAQLAAGWVILRARARYSTARPAGPASDLVPGRVARHPMPVNRRAARPALPGTAAVRTTAPPPGGPSDIKRE
jgi:hypothetical protein